MNGAVLLLSGPSGAGKSTIIKKASPYIGAYYFSISTTTRQPRDGERDGVEYFFVTHEEFEQGIENGDFLEYAEVHGNYYGTSLKPVKKALAEDKLVIFDIDVQGHRLARKSMDDIITSVFITPPSLSELRRRLTDRSTDTPDVIAHRIANAATEIKAIDEFDYILINDDIEKTVEDFITLAKTARLKPSKTTRSRLIEQWLRT